MCLAVTTARRHYTNLPTVLPSHAPHYGLILGDHKSWGPVTHAAPVSLHEPHLQPMLPHPLTEVTHLQHIFCRVGRLRGMCKEDYILLAVLKDAAYDGKDGLRKEGGRGGGGGGDGFSGARRCLVRLPAQLRVHETQEEVGATLLGMRTHNGRATVSGCK